MEHHVLINVQSTPACVVTEQFLCKLWRTFCDGLYCHSVLYRVSNCCFSVYWNIAGLWQSRKNVPRVLKSPGKVVEFFVGERAGSLPPNSLYVCLLLDMLHIWWSLSISGFFSCHSFYNVLMSLALFATTNYCFACCSGFRVGHGTIFVMLCTSSLELTTENYSQ